MLRAVLFDWGGTLVEGGYDAETAVAGHAAGLAALGPVPGLPGTAVVGERFVEAYLPGLTAAREDEIDYVEVVRSLFRDLGLELDRSEAWSFVAAEHRAWRSSHRLAPGILALLDAIRERDLLTGVVSNLFDPPGLVRAELERLGVSARLDVVVLSTETGKRKPHPASFLRALEQLEVAPSDALFVGDRVVEDIGGASALGMHTARAAWFARAAPASASNGDVTRPADLLELVDRLRTA